MQTLDYKKTTPGDGYSAASGAPNGADERLLSLDAYRGLIMIALAFNGFGLADTATKHLKENPDSSFCKASSFNFRT